MVVISSICPKPESSGKVYDLSLDVSGGAINLQNLKRNLVVYNKDIVEYYKYFNCVNNNYPENHANYKTYKDLQTGNIDYTGKKVNGKSEGDALLEYNNTVKQLQSVMQDVLTIGNNVDKDFKDVNTSITNLNKTINTLEKKIMPLKTQINKLKSNVDTSEGMLDNAQLIYNEKFTEMLLLGVLSIATTIAIYKNWSSMKT